MEIRQSLKAVKAAYLGCVLLEIVMVVLWYAGEFPSTMPFWAMGVLPPLLALFVVMRHIKRRMTRITISEDRLHYESGLASKSTRTVELAKVQDVRVNQTFWQRIFNVGSVSLETAGSSSRILMEAVDRPQDIANHILDMAKSAAKDVAQSPPPTPLRPPDGTAGAVPPR